MKITIIAAGFDKDGKTAAAKEQERTEQSSAADAFDDIFG